MEQLHLTMACKYQPPHLGEGITSQPRRRIRETKSQWDYDLQYGSGDQYMGNGVVPRISQVGLQVLQGTGAGVGYGLNDEPQKCDKCKTTCKNKQLNPAMWI